MGEVDVRNGINWYRFWLSKVIELYYYVFVKKMKYLVSNNRFEKNKCSLVLFIKYKILLIICLLVISLCFSVDNYVILWEYRVVV